MFKESNKGGEQIREPEGGDDRGSVKSSSNRSTIVTRSDEISNQLQNSIDVSTRNQREQSSVPILIYVKTLTGGILHINIQTSQTILDLKCRVQQKQGIPSDQQRMIYFVKQLQNQRTISDYNIRNQSTIHLVLRLRGDIGIFDHYQNQIGQEVLMGGKNGADGVDALKQIEVEELVRRVGGNREGKFWVGNQEIDQKERELLLGLVKFADQEYEKMKKANASVEQTQDLKIYLTYQQLAKLLTPSLVQKYLQISPTPIAYNTIILRRCQAHTKHLKFHIDAFSKNTLQISLSDDSDYEGGRLMYATHGKLHVPRRSIGTVTVHDCQVVHGVSRLEGGVRYGLFLLKK